MNALEITHKHGLEMRKIAFEHALAMAKLYRDYSSPTAIDELIAHLETKIAEEVKEDEPKQ